MQVKGVVGDLLGGYGGEPGPVEQVQGLLPAPHHPQSPAVVVEAHGHTVHEGDGVEEGGHGVVHVVLHPGGGFDMPLFKEGKSSFSFGKGS